MFVQVFALGTDDKPVVCDYDTDAVEVIDGALVIYTRGAKGVTAGFAPGRWMTFEMLPIEERDAQ